MRLSLVGFMCAVAIAGATSGCVVRVRKPAEPPPPPPPPAVVKEEPKPARKLRAFKLPEVKNNKVELPGPILFNEDKATLKPQSFAVLELVAEYLRQTPAVTKHRIEGHTDTDGDDAHNMALSKGRAYAVSKWLVSQGIDCNRLVPVGFGETRLKVTPERTADDKATNRRVDFVNAELKGQAIGGLPIDGGGSPAGNACN
ncbi:MAG: OmpA family protein [Deltaproteobacteria bacterium]|nr:OmpA family protein [Deltaproteobacteria bacterium]